MKVWNCSQNCKNTNHIILFHFSNIDCIFTAMHYRHINIRIRTNEEGVEKPGFPDYQNVKTV